MGVIIKMPHIQEKEYEIKNNIKQLKYLIDKYIPENKKFVINKIKNEQQNK